MNKIRFYNVQCSKQFREKFYRKEFRSPVELNKFRNIIRGIVFGDGSYGTEVVGEFFISPRGHRRERIAWFKEGDLIYLYEPLHHEGNKQGDYEKFIERTRNKIIKRKDYSGFEPVEIFMTL